MIKVVLSFLVVAVVFHFVIESWRYTSGKERWNIIKTLTYSLGLATLTFIALSLFVFLF
jgi:hypothetical protein